MTFLELSRTECANYDRGACRGVYIGDRGEITHCSPKPRCVLAEGAPCNYFATCVIPMVDIVREPHRAKEIQEAVWSYRTTHAAGVVTQHRRRGGQCGTLPPHKPRQGLCLPLQQRSGRNPYHDSHHPQNGNLTVAVKAPGVCEMERSVVA